MTNKPIILAIESAIRGGSIALFQNDEIVDTWLGEGGVSRAEDLLWNIDRMLKNHGIAKTSLTQIVVSIGPGSFTGIRIGLATAMGLANALNIDLAKYSILYAMAASQANNESLTTAVPVGRGVVCVQTFRKDVSEIVELTGPIAVIEGNYQHELLRMEVITPEYFPRGLAASLIDAVNDTRIPRANEPLFIAKPPHI